MRKLLPLLASSAALAATACSDAPEPAASLLACEPLPGAETLLESQAARLIVVGASTAPEGQAFLLTACAALRNGERVAALLPAGPEAEAARAALAAWAAQGAEIIVAALPTVDPAAPETAQPALARAMAEAPPADRTIALVDADSAARRPLGLSGQTWAPAGALLPMDTAVTLRAMEAPGTAPRLSFAPFEDVPEHGASRAYDGLITLPATASSTAAADDLRGR